MGTRIRTDWYHKAIASNRILNFHFRHPANMIKNVAKSFIRRVLRISHSSFHSDNIKIITDILNKNNFPTVIIEKLLSQVVHSTKCNHQQTTNSYPFLETSEDNVTAHRGPAANSTMILEQTTNGPGIGPGITMLPKA